MGLILNIASFIFKMSVHSLLYLGMEVYIFKFLLGDFFPSRFSLLMNAVFNMLFIYLFINIMVPSKIIIKSRFCGLSDAHLLQNWQVHQIYRILACEWPDIAAVGLYSHLWNGVLIQCQPGITAWPKVWGRIRSLIYIKRSVGLQPLKSQWVYWSIREFFLGAN